MGWRYFLFTLGSVMLLFSFIRSFAFPLYESPRYLIGRGHDAEAVAVVHKIARYNGTETSLTVEDLEKAARCAAQKGGVDKWRVLSEGSVWTAGHVRALFSGKKMAWSTSLLIWIWGSHFPMKDRSSTYPSDFRIRTYRPRINALQRLPAISVSFTTFHTILWAISRHFILIV